MENPKTPYAISKQYLRELKVLEENINSYYKKLSALRERINPGIEQRPPDKEFYLKCTDGVKIFIQKFIPERSQSYYSVPTRSYHSFRYNLPACRLFIRKKHRSHCCGQPGTRKKWTGRGVFDKPD